MLNKIVLIGRLTRDPELRYTAAGVPFASFTLAVDRGFANGKGERETDFINVAAWNKLGESCANYLSKGKLAAVAGSLQVRKYEKDGVKHTLPEVHADEVRFLSPKDTGQSTPDYAPARAPEGSADDSRPW